MALATLGGVFAGIVSQAAPKGTDLMNDEWFVAALGLALVGAVLITLTVAGKALGRLGIFWQGPLRVRAQWRSPLARRPSGWPEWNADKFITSRLLAELNAHTAEADLLMQRCDAADSGGFFSRPTFPNDLARDYVAWKRAVETSLANEPDYLRHFSATLSEANPGPLTPGDEHPYARELRQRVVLLYSILERIESRDRLAQDGWRRSTTRST